MSSYYPVLMFVFLFLEKPCYLLVVWLSTSWCFGKLGLTCDEISDFYNEVGGKVFSKSINNSDDIDDDGNNEEESKTND